MEKSRKVFHLDWREFSNQFSSDELQHLITYMPFKEKHNYVLILKWLVPTDSNLTKQKSAMELKACFGKVPVEHKHSLERQHWQYPIEIRGSFLQFRCKSLHTNNKRPWFWASVLCTASYRKHGLSLQRWAGERVCVHTRKQFLHGCSSVCLPFTNAGTGVWSALQAVAQPIVQCQPCGPGTHGCCLQGSRADGAAAEHSAAPLCLGGAAKPQSCHQGANISEENLISSVSHTF